MAGFRAYLKLSADTPPDLVLAMYDEATELGFWSDPDHHQLPRWLWRPIKARVFVRWDPDWYAGAVAVASNDADYRRGMPAGVRAGDLVITVLECEPPLVASLERITGGDPDRLEADQFVLPSPVAWDAVADGLVPAPRRRSGRPTRGQELFDRAQAAAHWSAPARVRLCGCSGLDSGLLTALLLEGDPEQLRCDTCQEPLHPDDAVAHILLAEEDVDLRRAVEQAVLICSDCDLLLHAPTVDDLRRRLRPACPECGLRRLVPIVWGLAAHSDEDSVYGGWQVPDDLSELPQWCCRACGSDVRMSGAGGWQDPLFTPETLRRHDGRPLYTLAEVARAMRRGPDAIDIDNELSNHADADIRLRDDDNQGFTVALSTYTDAWSLRLEYPVTLSELYQVVDQLNLEANEEVEREFEDSEQNVCAPGEALRRARKPRLG